MNISVELILLIAFVLTCLYFPYDYLKNKREKKLREISRAVEEKRDRIDFMKSLKEKYQQIKTEITTDNLKPKDSILSLNKNETIYLECTNLLARLYKKDDNTIYSSLISLLILTDHRLIIFYKNESEAFKVENIKGIEIQLFGIRIHLENEIESIFFELLLKEIVRFERTAEKIGIPIERCLEPSENSEGYYSVATENKNHVILTSSFRYRNPWWQIQDET